MGCCAGEAPVGPSSWTAHCYLGHRPAAVVITPRQWDAMGQRHRPEHLATTPLLPRVLERWRSVLSWRRWPLAAGILGAIASVVALVDWFGGRPALDLTGGFRVGVACSIICCLLTWRLCRDLMGQGAHRTWDGWVLDLPRISLLLASATAAAAPASLAFVRVTSYSWFAVSMSLLVAAGTSGWVLINREASLAIAGERRSPRGRFAARLVRVSGVVTAACLTAGGALLAAAQDVRPDVNFEDSAAPELADGTSEGAPTVPEVVTTTTEPSVATKPTVLNTTIERCPIHPGQDLAEPISTAMRLASEARADASWGCVGRAESIDGYFVQRFASGGALLVGSTLGAGVVPPDYAPALLRGDEVSRAGLAGQPLGRIDCLDRTADLIAVTGTEGTVVRLVARSDKVSGGRPASPVEVDPGLLDAFAAHWRGGHFIFPVEEAIGTEDGRLHQTFVDRSAPARVLVVLERSSEGSTLYPSELWGPCNPASPPAPSWLLPLERTGRS